MFLEAARAETESSLKIGATVGVIGIIIGVLTFSGLVLTFADIVIELAEGSLVLTILLIALASLVLGMGVPVTAAYLITAVVAVPALIHLGVNEIVAHKSSTGFLRIRISPRLFVLLLLRAPPSPKPTCGERRYPLSCLPNSSTWPPSSSDLFRVSPCREICGTSSRFSSWYCSPPGVIPGCSAEFGFQL